MREVQSKKINLVRNSGTQVFLKAGVEFFGVVNREDDFFLIFEAMLREQRFLASS